MSKAIFLVWNDSEDLALVTDDVLRALSYWWDERRKIEGERPFIEVRRLDSLRSGSLWGDQHTQDLIDKFDILKPRHLTASRYITETEKELDKMNQYLIEMKKTCEAQLKRIDDLEGRIANALL